jgi:hypothetical protein
LWSPNDPFLYGLKIQLKDERGYVVDAVGSYFGMRSVSLGIVNGQLHPLLNGKFVFQLGPLDQGNWPDGIYTAPTDAALKFDLETTKKLGFNFVRKHEKIEPQRWYYWADKLGLMVWQDLPTIVFPDEQLRPQFEKEWKEIIDQHRNSPAIVTWVPFNEGWGAYDVDRITSWTKQYDPTRFVDGNSGYPVDGSNGKLVTVESGDPPPGYGDFDDRHIYTGPGNPASPNAIRAAVLGEYGGLHTLVPGHVWPTAHGNPYTQPSVEALTDSYIRVQESLRQLIEKHGLGAAVYTEITDVEHELCGFLTYDRKFEKMDFARVREENLKVIQTGDNLNQN